MDKLIPFIEIIEKTQWRGPLNIYLSKWSTGWGNGYVHLPPGHKWYGWDYNTIPVDIHGGLTFGQWDKEHINWVIGFDTAHSGDTLENWPKERVIEETNDLLKQCL